MRLIIFVIAVMCLTGCVTSENELRFGKEKAVVFGDNSGPKAGIIGDVGFMAIDDKLDLYVIDNAYKKIKKYSKEGAFIKDYGNGEGRGPGEFINPFGIDVDKAGNIYVIDMAKREVTVIDSSNQVVKTLKTDFIPTNIVVTDPGIVYLSGVPATYTGELVYKYDLNAKEDYDKPVLKFCDRIDSKGNKALEKNTYRDSMTKDKRGIIYYAFAYPYEIRAFNQDGKLLDTYTRNIKNFDPPYNKTVNGRTVSVKENGIIDPIVLTDKTMFIRVFQQALKKEYYDFYNLESKSYMGTINADNLDIKMVLHTKGDGEGNIYYSQSEPYPHIVKAKLTIKGSE